MHEHHHPHAPFLPTRRGLIGGFGAGLALSLLGPRRALAQAAPAPRCLVLVDVMGAVDGMSMVVPYGDRHLRGLRARLVPRPVGTPGGMFDLGGFFGLSPHMPNLAAMYGTGQMLAAHAVGGILATRSHFDGQAALQSGIAAAGMSGWINRLVSLMPPAASGGVEPGLVLGAQVPVLAQGPAVFGAYAPPAFGGVSPLASAALQSLSAADPLLGPAAAAGFLDAAFLGGIAAANPAPRGASAFVSDMYAAGAFLAAPGGPNVIVVESTPMDTHTDQVKRLAPLLSDLDAGIGALAAAAGPAWANTVVMTVTEFGRTAYENGSGGTDHGTGFAMLLAGGAVAGGRVVADWPGLSPTQLLDGRDLQPTVDVRSVAMGVLRDHLGLSAAGLEAVFPGSSAIPVVSGLVVSGA